MKFARRRTLPGAALALALLIVVSGCATNRISRPDQWAPATEVQSKMVWTFFWGAMHQDVHPSNCLGPGLSEVTVKSNFGFALISVLTLGTAMPVTIEWRCAKDAPTGGDNF
jgi:hypothetical protein